MQIKIYAISSVYLNKNVKFMFQPDNTAIWKPGHHTPQHELRPLHPCPIYKMYVKDLDMLNVYLYIVYVYTCNSCIIVCTVYGIRTARGLHMYFRGRSLRKYMKARGRYNHRHCINYDTAHLYPHLLESSFWHWNVIICPGGCTIDNHIRPGSQVWAPEP